MQPALRTAPPPAAVQLAGKTTPWTYFRQVASENVCKFDYGVGGDRRFVCGLQCGLQCGGPARRRRTGGFYYSFSINKISTEFHQPGRKPKPELLAIPQVKGRL